jgi:peptidoglycan/LPS O-acetylase OafA/YrhL
MGQQITGRDARRLPGLDLLRAIAIGWVMIYHASLYDLLPGGTWPVDFGWMGVDLFFVLSGFLIASQVLRPWASGERPDYGRFFTRRLLRTIPAYAVVLAIYVLIPSARDRGHMQPVWTFLTFTQNFTIHIPPAQAFSHAWSLCVEEQFYLAFPLAVALLGIRPTSFRTLAAMAALVVLGMALRGWFWLHDVARTPFDLASDPRPSVYMRLIYYPTWTRLDGLLAGIGAALVSTFQPQAWRALTARPNLLSGGGLLGVGAAIMLFGDQIAGFWGAVFGYPLLSLSMAALVVAGASASSVIGRRAIPGAGAVAAASYSLYLSHKMVYHWASELPATTAIKPLMFPLALLAALAVGAVLYRLVERPCLRLRDRISQPLLASPAVATAVESEASRVT